MPFSEKHRGRSTSKQQRQQPTPPQPCVAAATTTTTSCRNSVRKSRSATRDDRAAASASVRRSKSRSLSRASTSNTSPPVNAWNPRSPTTTTQHRRSGGIPNISFGRRRGRSETPKLGEGEQQRLYRHRSGGGGFVNKFRSLSRSTPNISMRGGESDDRVGMSRTTTKHPKEQQNQKGRQRERSPNLERNQFHRRNTSNEARRKFDTSTDDITTTLPIPKKRGHSMPSRMKVSLRLSRDSQEMKITKGMHANMNSHHTSRSRSRHRSRSHSNTHGKKEHARSEQRVATPQKKTHSRHASHNKSPLATSKDKIEPSSRHPTNRKTNANHPNKNRVRSKSMPTGILRNGILNMDRQQSIQHPISTIASIDSSWRYKRIKMLKKIQRHRQEQQLQHRSDDDIIYYEKGRIRSSSWDPSMLRAVVPYHADYQNIDSSNINSSTYLNYNLGEMDEELVELLRQQKSQSPTSPASHSSWQWPSRSPKTRSRRRNGESTPTYEEPSPSGEKAKFVASSIRSSRIAGNGRGDDASYIMSSGETDTDTTGWQGHAPDPVKSLHGSSNWTADLTYQLASPTTYSFPVPAPPLVTSPSSPANSRECFIGIIEDDGGGLSGKKLNNSQSSWGDRSVSNRRESMSTPSSQSTSPADQKAKKDDDDDNYNSDTPESIFNNTPSTHVKYEKKLIDSFLVPPLHSTVRSRKPKAKVVPISPHHRSHSHHHHPFNTTSGGTEKHSTFTEHKPKSGGGFVEGMTIPKKDSDSSVDHMSEVTMPLALSRVPPPHEFIRSVKPPNRLHGTSSHPTSPVTKNSSQKQYHPEGMSPQFLMALRAIHQVNASQDHSHKSLEHLPKAVAAVPIYPPPPPPPPPPRRMAPGPPRRNQYKHALNQLQQQQHTANSDNPSQQHPQSQTHPSGITPDDLFQSVTHLRCQRERHHHSDRALFPPQSSSRERYIEMTGGGQPSGVLHSSMKDLSNSNESNNWQLHQLLLSSTAELTRLRGATTMSPEREQDQYGGVQQIQMHAPPTLSIGGSTSARQRGKRVENMPYMDGNHDMGVYTGETNDLGQPHGKGQMRYDNGIFFEGKWTNGTFT